MSEEQSLKEKLVEYANEYEYTVSVGSLRTEAEIQSDIQKVCDKLGWTEEEAHEYVSFLEQRY
jgi:hypothetical protein|tara:strand:+ start:102 stop:290 length:189 start_codon:yes stop_codon:yes gene_type:complete